MNEGNSAGGGHEGLSPAPPAVPDRVTSYSTEKSVGTPKHITTSGPTSSGSRVAIASPAARHHHHQQHQPTQGKGIASKQQQASQQQKSQLPSAQLPVPLSPLPLQQQTTEATAATPAAETPAPASSSSSSSSTSIIDSSVSPPQAKRQRLDNDQPSSLGSSSSSSSIVGTASSNIVGSLLPASVAASNEVGGVSSTALQDLNALKKRILQQKLQILRNLKERWESNT